MGGEVGFDEGGVLQALATPIIHQEVKTTKKYKSGRIKETTSCLEITGAHVLALLLGKGMLALFVKGKGKLPESPEEWTQFLIDTVPFYGAWLQAKLNRIEQRLKVPGQPFGATALATGGEGGAAPQPAGTATATKSGGTVDTGTQMGEAMRRILAELERRRQEATQ